MSDREVDRFEAKSDNGTLYTVIEYRRVIRTTLMEGTRETLGTRSWALSDGRDLNWINDSTFKIVATDEIIRKL